MRTCALGRTGNKTLAHKDEFTLECSGCGRFYDIEPDVDTCACTAAQCACEGNTYCNCEPGVCPCVECEV